MSSRIPGISTQSTRHYSAIMVFPWIPYQVDNTRRRAHQAEWRGSSGKSIVCPRDWSRIPDIPKAVGPGVNSARFSHQAEETDTHFL